MGFSHLGAALSILVINASVVLGWLLSWKLGASIDVQTYIVVALGLLVTFGFYKLMKSQQNGGSLDEEGYPQERSCGMPHSGWGRLRTAKTNGSGAP